MVEALRLLRVGWCDEEVSVLPVVPVSLTLLANTERKRSKGFVRWAVCD